MYIDYLFLGHTSQLTHNTKKFANVYVQHDNSTPFYSKTRKYLVSFFLDSILCLNLRIHFVLSGLIRGILWILSYKSSYAKAFDPSWLRSYIPSCLNPSLSDICSKLSLRLRIACIVAKVIVLRCQNYSSWYNQCRK